jgi:hypothetical protein
MEFFRIHRDIPFMRHALVLNLILAQITRLKAGADAEAAPPVLLLDEAPAHLDAARRAALFDEIEALKLQAFMTGTERPLFAALEGRAQFVAVHDPEFLERRDVFAPAMPGATILVNTTVAPEKFFSAAERYQLAPAIDRWVVRRVLQTLKPHAADLARRGASFAVNISGQSVGDAEFCAFLEGALVFIHGGKMEGAGDRARRYDDSDRSN